jgi:hypothetical protein
MLTRFLVGSCLGFRIDSHLGKYVISPTQDFGEALIPRSVIDTCEFTKYLLFLNCSLMISKHDFHTMK